MSEGSIYRRKDGYWIAKYRDADGGWKYLYRKTKGEARKALREALKDRDEGIVPVGKMSLNDLLDSWLEDIEGTVSPRTLENCQSAIRVHITLRGYLSCLTRISSSCTGIRFLGGS